MVWEEGYDVPEYVKAISGECDEDKYWITQEEEEIPYSELETSHIANIMNRFGFTKKQMPNLYKEFLKRKDWANQTMSKTLRKELFNN